MTSFPRAQVKGCRVGEPPSVQCPTAQPRWGTGGCNAPTPYELLVAWVIAPWLNCPPSSTLLRRQGSGVGVSPNSVWLASAGVQGSGQTQPLGTFPEPSIRKQVQKLTGNFTSTLWQRQLHRAVRGPSQRGSPSPTQRTARTQPSFLVLHVHSHAGVGQAGELHLTSTST